MKMPVRSDRVEEIKAVWDSPNFKTNAQRLVHLFRHCRKIEYGYTIREFGHVLFPDHYDEYMVLKNVRQIFRRFRKDATNHEIVLFAGLVKGTGSWYYYNMIDDDKTWKEVQFRLERIGLGYERALQRIEGIAEMSDEDRRILTERTSQEIIQRATERQEKKKRKAKK